MLWCILSPSDPVCCWDECSASPRCYDAISRLQTLYAVETSVVPPPGMNLCSAGSMCDLLVDVQSLTSVQPAVDSLFYQVRSDNYWAVCDSTAAGEWPSSDRQVGWWGIDTHLLLLAFPIRGRSSGFSYSSCSYLLYPPPSLQPQPCPLSPHP